eukprot:gene8153-8346_t
MEHDDSLFMATGYPFDIVTLPTDSSWASSSWIARLLMHAAASYHLPLLIGFSVADKGSFVWREGGYSDDLLLAGYCAATQRSIGLPASALFPQLLAPGCTWKQYWNYLRRQLFVLDTYYNRHNQVINHTMMIAHSYGSAVFTMAAAATGVQLTLLLLLLLGLSFCWVFGLFRVLSSDAKPQVAHPRVSWVLLWAGWLLSNAVLPYCMLYTYLCNHIEWSGTVYHKKSGKVVRVVHKQEQ